MISRIAKGIDDISQWKLFPTNEGASLTIIDTLESFGYKDGECKSLGKELRYTYPDRDFRGSCQDYYEAKILVNGCYFHAHSQYVNRASKDHSILYACGERHYLKEILDPETAISIYDMPRIRSTQFACLSSNKKEIFLYHIKDYMLAPTGASLFCVDGNDVKISAIAALSDLQTFKHPFMIILNIGIIKIGHVQLSKFIEEKELCVLPIDHDIDKLKLFSSNALNIFIAYSDNCLLRIWHKNNNYEYTDYQMPKLLSLSISTSQNYLSGILDEKAATSTLYILDLTKISEESIKVYIVKLDYHLDDFVIGADDVVFTLVNQELKQNNKLKDFLTKHYQKIADEAQKELSALQQQPPAQEVAQEDEAAHSCCGFFRRK